MLILCDTAVDVKSIEDPVAALSKLMRVDHNQSPAAHSEACARAAAATLHALNNGLHLILHQEISESEVVELGAAIKSVEHLLSWIMRCFIHLVTSQPTFPAGLIQDFATQVSLPSRLAGL